MARTSSVKVGDVFPTTYGVDCTVIEWKNSVNILVEFNDKHLHRKWVTSSNLTRGNVHNPYTPFLYGKGFLGEVVRGQKIEEAYFTWYNMFVRCHDPLKYPTYVDCGIAEEWFNYKTFSEWFCKQKREVGVALR